MNSEAESILSNLRLLAALPDDNWILTQRIDGKLNVVGFCNNTTYNNMLLSMFQEGWSATHECLKSLYCERLPRLTAKLLENEDFDDVRRLSEILGDSVDGLKKIRNSYDDPAIKAHMESIMFDFAVALNKKIQGLIKAE